MSLIPLDESRGDGPSDATNSPGNASLTGRVRAGLRAVLLALPGVSALANRRAGDRPRPVADTSEPDGPPDRTAPAPLPGGSSNVEVVSTETEDTLTVEAVDGAHRTNSYTPSSQGGISDTPYSECLAAGQRRTR